MTGDIIFCEISADYIFQDQDKNDEAPDAKRLSYILERKLERKAVSQ